MNKMLFVFCGASGAGKSTLGKTLPAPLLKSYITRPIRKGEVDGEDGYFITVDEFKSMLAAGKLVESTYYDGHYKGIARDDLNITEHMHIVLNKEGIETLRDYIPRDNMFIFHVWAPDEYRVRRMKLQGRDDDEINRRLEEDKPLIKWYFDNADCSICNINLADAIIVVKSIYKVVIRELTHSENNAS